ncbi:Uncharacterised protein [Porphyromonas macacae]|uniref:Uncharacterized protein n=1 Tax=Porphyromonas macacae TaxID=28115 RepID=A0A379DKT4_9PORP|nr:Uncharacterised protein [Porphyromonas macacae]
MHRNNSLLFAYLYLSTFILSVTFKATIDHEQLLLSRYSEQLTIEQIHKLLETSRR